MFKNIKKPVFDYGVVFYLVAAVIMLIVPIPTWFMDFLLSFDMSMSVVILLTAMFSTEVMDMSFFPTVLLVTTIFRIALNISSTRLILSDGNAGKVIEVFGQFVGAGDLIIGTIVYVILILVQFMVIHKSSERVAEVSARFILDTMPSKQMDIDSDLNTGAITDQEAKERREKIQKEASFYGAMDDATKYLNGAAIAGIIITVVNIIGGILMGVLGQGMPIADALDKYAILTMGDGLTSAIPLLLVSLSTGVLVTKSSKEDQQTEEIRQPENVTSVLQVDPIELEFGYGIIPLTDVNQGGDLLDRVVMIRRQIALELGTVVPIIRLRDNIQLNPNQYIIKIKGIQVSDGEILLGHYMAMNPGNVEEEITGIPTFEPSFHLPATWITESQRERAESLGYTVVDSPSIIATHLTEVIRKHIAELLTRQDVQNLVNNLQENNPALVDELVPKLMSLGEIEKVLQNLLAEGISIRDLVTIFETLADYAPSTHDSDILTEYVRQSLRRAISNKYFYPGETTSVITLDPKIEQEIMQSVKQTETGAYLTLDPTRTKAILKSVGEQAKKLEDAGMIPIIMTSPIVRMYFKKMTEDYYKDLIVLSYNEVNKYDGHKS